MEEKDRIYVHPDIFHRGGRSSPNDHWDNPPSPPYRYKEIQQTFLKTA